MPRKVKIAAVQMDASPTPVTKRLARAADLVAEAASAGAKLIVLPEVFNTGYEYSEANYPAAEPINGPTVTWMKTQAKKHKIYLAGTLLLLDEEDIYNTALLVAPNGHLWRYDKNFPFTWERAYFREGRGITIADTPLGKLGMMICWDSAHAEQWARYAGKVDALLIMSCPPKMSAADVVFPDGTRANIKELMPEVYTPEEFFPGKDMDEHAAWLRVPVVHTVGSGQFRSSLPLSLLSIGAFIIRRPEFWAKLPQADAAWLESGFDKQTKIIDAAGQVIARVNDDGDGYTLAEVTLADETPKPGYEQPKMRTPKEAFFLSDILGNALMTVLYRRGVRRQWGAQMAPIDPRTKIWGGLAGIALVLGWFFGRIGRR